jgi:ABC-type Fe3+ transport system permease subunit
VVLKEAFDEAEPRSLSQLWFDRRVRVQWYTLWVAVLVFILTIFFGLVQSVEGALQVYLAFRSGKEQPEAR